MQKVTTQVQLLEESKNEIVYPCRIKTETGKVVHFYEEGSGMVEVSDG